MKRILLLGLSCSAAALLGLSACGSDTADSTFDGGASSSSGGSSSGRGIDPGDSGSRGDGSQSTSSGTPGVITVTLRDFQHWVEGDATRNPDFENVPGPPPGKNAPYAGPWTESPDDFLDENGNPAQPEYRVAIVKPDLGADGKPVYDESNGYQNTPGRTATTHGKAAFDQWYRDVAGVNMNVQATLTLKDQGNGVFSYDSKVDGIARSASDPTKNFFPLDGEGFGNTPVDVVKEKSGDPNANLDHNYHFTMELHTQFTYAGTETFRFTGDDDIFVYVNGKLVIDIGGIHGVAQKEVSLPAVAATIGLEVGKDYPLDLFQAERHVTGSNVRMDTTIKLRAVTPPN